MCVQSLGCVQLLVTISIVACWAPLSMGFVRQECQSGLSFPSPGDLPNPSESATGDAACPARKDLSKFISIWIKLEGIIWALFPNETRLSFTSSGSWGECGLIFVYSQQFHVIASWSQSKHRTGNFQFSTY